VLVKTFKSDHLIGFFYVCNKLNQLKIGIFYGAATAVAPLFLRAKCY